MSVSVAGRRLLSPGLATRLATHSVVKLAIATWLRRARAFSQAPRPRAARPTFYCFCSAPTAVHGLELPIGLIHLNVLT